MLGGLGRALGPDLIPTIALFVNALADAATVVLLIRIARHLLFPGPLVVVASLLFGLSPLVVRYSVGGMETSMVALLFVGSTLLFLRGQRTLAFLAAAVAIGFRPDALAIGAGLLVADLRLEGKAPLRSLAILAGGVILEAGLLWVAYRLPAPNSLIAKAAEIYHIDPLANFWQFVYLLSGLTTTGVAGFGARGLIVSPAPGLNTLALVLLLPQLGLAYLGGRGILRRGDEPIPLIVVPLVYLSVYTALGLRGSLMAEWYLVPLLPAWFLILGSGAAVLIASPTSRARWILGHSLPLVLLVLMAISFAPRAPFGWRPLNAWTEREDLYRAASEYLNRSVRNDTLVAASEVGAIGYYCRCTVFDTVGLVSPEATSHYPVPKNLVVGNYAVPLSLIRDLEPEYLVTLEVFVRKTLLPDEWFLQNYRVVWFAQTGVFGSDGMMIFRRK